jgi:hypothetical protein
VFDIDKNIILEHIPWWEFKIEKFLIFMPISPKKAIIYTPIKDESNIPKDEFIEIINLGQYINCTEGVFSCNKMTLERQLKEFIINSHMKG